MSKAKKILEKFETKLDEGTHFNTKIKMLEASNHPVKVRLALKECCRMVENILNPNHPSPNPFSDEDRKALESCNKKIHSLAEGLRSVKVSRRKSQ